MNSLQLPVGIKVFLVPGDPVDMVGFLRNFLFAEQGYLQTLSGLIFVISQWHSFTHINGLTDRKPCKCSPFTIY